MTETTSLSAIISNLPSKMMDVFFNLIPTPKQHSICIKLFIINTESTMSIFILVNNNCFFEGGGVRNMIPIQWCKFYLALFLMSYSCGRVCPNFRAIWYTVTWNAPQHTVAVKTNQALRLSTHKSNAENVQQLTCLDFFPVIVYAMCYYHYYQEKLKFKCRIKLHSTCIYNMSLCGFSTCENIVDLIKLSVASMQGYPLKYLIHFS